MRKSAIRQPNNVLINHKSGLSSKRHRILGCLDIRLFTWRYENLYRCSQCIYHEHHSFHSEKLLLTKPHVLIGDKDIWKASVDASGLFWLEPLKSSWPPNLSRHPDSIQKWDLLSPEPNPTAITPHIIMVLCIIPHSIPIVGAISPWIRNYVMIYF